MSRKVTGGQCVKGERLKVTANQRNETEITPNYLPWAVRNSERAITPVVGKNPRQRLHTLFDDRNVDYWTGLTLVQVQVVWP